MRNSPARLIAAAAAVILLLTSCAAPQGTAVTSGVAYNDSTGGVVVPQTSYAAALSGSYADMWLLAGGTLVGATSDAFDAPDSSGKAATLELDESVRDLGSLKNPSVEAILELKPDAAFLSAEIAGQNAIRGQLESAGITCVSLSVETFGDYLKALKLMTDMTGRHDLYEKYGASQESRISELKLEFALRSYSPSAMLLRAYSTGVKAKGSDNMAGAMIADLGAHLCADDDKSIADTVSLETLASLDPDYIFLTTMGDESAAEKEFEALFSGNPAWENLTAVRNGKFCVLPAELFHTKPNARWAEAYEYLAEILR